MTCAACAATLAGGLTALVPSAANAQGIPKLTYSGTISMYAANYNPPIVGVKVAPGALTDNTMATAAAGFREVVP